MTVMSAILIGVVVLSGLVPAYWEILLKLGAGIPSEKQPDGLLASAAGTGAVRGKRMAPRRSEGRVASPDTLTESYEAWQWAPAKSSGTRGRDIPAPVLFDQEADNERSTA